MSSTRPSGVALRRHCRGTTAENGEDRVLGEMALNHVVGSHVERSYRRSDLIARRRALAKAWADHCRPLW